MTLKSYSALREKGEFHTHREGVCVGTHMQRSRAAAPLRRSSAAAPPLLPQPVLYTEVQQSELLLRGLPWKAAPPEVALFLLGCGFQVNEGDIQLCLYKGRPNGRAIVRAKTPEDAIMAQSAVHGRAWGERYIEASMRSSCARTWCSAQFCDTQFPPRGRTTQFQA